MDKFWLEEAKRYIQEHNSFVDVSDVSILDDSNGASISAVALVNMPSTFIDEGETDIGVRAKEDVQFVFPEQFPLVAPVILLRDDFPRCFPHINPSKREVIPCIYDGNPSELLQQSEWMNGILNQLIDWLEKAAANELLNYDQGWEPMRNDDPAGFIFYDIQEVLSQCNVICEYKTRSVAYEQENGLFFANIPNVSNIKKTHILYCMNPTVIDSYIPNAITKLSELYQYAHSIGIVDLKEEIEFLDQQHREEDILIVTLLVQRPVNLIGHNVNIELLNFIVHKSARKKQKKRVLPDSKVEMLLHINNSSQNLMKELSGTNTKIDERDNIALLGCGSLGSKIGAHLARNGNGPFLCIDNDMFLPHNNARHALAYGSIGRKADLMAYALWTINNRIAIAKQKSAFDLDYENSRIIIDSTASLSVRNFLMSKNHLPPVVSAALYKHGQYGLLLLENNLKTNDLKNLWAHLYWKSTNNIDIRSALFGSELKAVNIGQSCRSTTMVVDDSRISIMAASMSIKIQQVLEDDLSDKGEILFLKYNEDYSLSTELLSVKPSIAVPGRSTNDFAVFLSESVYKGMKQSMQEKDPNETGGVLLGSVFLHSKAIYITDIIPAPPDSIETPNQFILGVEGLEKRVRSIEKCSNGKVTYLGTWHSHPSGGDASNTDKKTFEKLLFVRNYEPTVCIIITPEKVIVV